MLKNFKFKKSKYPLIPISFYTAIFFTIFTIIFNIIFYPTDFKKNKYFSNIKPTETKIYFNKVINHNPLICYDNNCRSLQRDLLSEIKTSTHLYSDINEEKNKISKIFIAFPKNHKNFKKDIEKITFAIGRENYTFTPSIIEKMEHKEFQIEIEENNKVKTETYQTIALTKNGNQRSFLSNLKVFLLSFLNLKAYLSVYLCIIFTIFIYIFNKQEIISTNNKFKEYFKNRKTNTQKGE